MSIHILYELDLYKNEHYIKKYIRFISSRKGIKILKKTSLHHILPKAADMFPEFKDLKQFNWNGVHLTHREHYIAHWMLNKAFPKSSQTRAFYAMCNELGFRNSKAYQTAKEYHIECFILSNKKPERCRKLSESLKGKPKTEEHKNKLRGHIVTKETREKISLKNKGKKRTQKQKDNISRNQLGKKKIGMNEVARKNISIGCKKIQRHWYNNGEISKTFTQGNLPMDSNWIKGRLPWVK